MAIWNVYDTSIVTKIVGVDSPNKSSKELARERNMSVEAFVRKKASEAHIREKKQKGKGQESGSPDLDRRDSRDAPEVEAPAVSDP